MTTAPMPEKVRKPRRPAADVVPDLVLVVLAVAGLVLSGWSLSTLLHGSAGTPWPVAVFAVGVFDLVAVAACFLVYARREAPWSAAGARLVMTVALAASAAVNGAHGYHLGGWTTAAVLAAAPVSFEVVFELRHRTLTVLVWYLFRGEAMAALRMDAWRRIAPEEPETDQPRIVKVTGATVGEVARRVHALSAVPAESGPDDPPPVRRIVPDSAPADSARSGSVKDTVRALMESGTTDPAAVVAAVREDRPEANPETIKRMVRHFRTEGGYV